MNTQKSLKLKTVLLYSPAQTGYSQVYRHVIGATSLEQGAKLIVAMGDTVSQGINWPDQPPFIESNKKLPIEIENPSICSISN